MVNRVSNNIRGRKPKQFSRLAQSFRSKTTREQCKAKPFADDKSRCFVRYLLKNKSFEGEMVFIVRALDEMIIKTSNQKADLAIDLVKNSGSLMDQIRKKFMEINDWHNHLERILKIEYCGNGSRIETLEKLFDCICQYIGPKNDDSDEEILENIENEENYYYHRAFSVQIEPCMLDEISPGSWIQGELENNRENNIPSAPTEVDTDYSLENLETFQNDISLMQDSIIQIEDLENLENSEARKSTDWSSNT
jgi:hypothetical protein